jgi:hypothetical protein
MAWLIKGWMPVIGRLLYESRYEPGQKYRVFCVPDFSSVFPVPRAALQLSNFY